MCEHSCIGDIRVLASLQFQHRLQSCVSAPSQEERNSMVRSLDPPPSDASAQQRQSQDSEEDARTARHRQYAKARRREGGAAGGVLSTLRQVRAG